MAVSYEEALSNIRQYADEAQAVQLSLMDVDDDDPHLLKERLDRTVEALRERLQVQQSALERIRSTSTSRVFVRPSTDRRERLKQLHTIRAAYESMNHTKPNLPSRDSALPALLAARTLEHAIVSAKAALHTDQDRLADTQRRLSEEEASLRDARLLTAALQDRMARLRAQQEQQQHDTPRETSAQKARKLLREKKDQHRHYEREAERLQGSLRDFVTGHLGALLAAEELSGPVVGDAPGADDDVLAAGFSSQGRPKASTASGGSNSKRQRRIDEIWGRAGDDSSEEDDGPRNERQAAGAEFLALMESLLDAQSRGTGNTDSYVSLDRDSASARFLIRAKVAQFHPKDAKRLRLVDFGRELDD